MPRPRSSVDRAADFESACASSILAGAIADTSPALLREGHDDSRRLERPDALEEDGHREHQCCEVRAAACREAGWASRAAPGLDETALLRGCDRSMLGTVQRQRAAAQEPEDESEGDRETRDQRNA